MLVLEFGFRLVTIRSENHKTINSLVLLIYVTSCFTTSPINDKEKHQICIKLNFTYLPKNIWMLSKNIIKLCAACRPSVVVLAAVSSGRPSCCYFLPALAAATGWSPPGLSSSWSRHRTLSSTQYLSGKAAKKIILSVILKGNSTVTVMVKLRQYFQEWNGPVNSGCRQTQNWPWVNG